MQIKEEHNAITLAGEGGLKGEGNGKSEFPLHMGDVLWREIDRHFNGHSARRDADLYNRRVLVRQKRREQVHLLPGRDQLYGSLLIFQITPVPGICTSGASAGSRNCDSGSACPKSRT